MRGYITDPTAPGGVRLADDLPEPEPSEGEVVVEVHAFSVNRGELSLLQQRPTGWRPGQDLAGVVVSVPAGSSAPPTGTKVVGVVDWHSWAERVAVPASQLASLPDGVGFDVAASLPIAGLTALRALRVGGSVLGSRVLVTGATGGVGHFAVQLGVAAGAHVTAQVSSPDRIGAAKDLGAHAAYTTPDANLGPFDLILDGVGGVVLRDSMHLLAPGGTAVTYGTVGGPAELGLADFASAGGPFGKLVGLFHAYPAETRGQDLDFLARLVADGKLVPVLSSVKGWEELRSTLDALRRRELHGKAVLVRS